MPQKDVGLPLYERSGRGIAPTPVGVRLAEESGEVFSSLRRLEATLEDLRRDPRPRLGIGCFSSAAKEWIPAIVSSAVTEFPHGDVRDQSQSRDGCRGLAPARS